MNKVQFFLMTGAETAPSNSINLVGFESIQKSVDFIIEKFSKITNLEDDSNRKRIKLFIFHSLANNIVSTAHLLKEMLERKKLLKNNLIEVKTSQSDYFYLTEKYVEDTNYTDENAVLNDLIIMRIYISSQDDILNFSSFKLEPGEIRLCTK